MREVSSPAVNILAFGDIPPHLGSFPNIHSSHQNTVPLPYPSSHLNTAHADISFGDTIAPSGNKCCLFIVDQYTCKQLIYGLKSANGADLVKVFQQFQINARGWPKNLYTNFDQKLIPGACHDFLQRQMVIFCTALGGGVDAKMVWSTVKGSPYAKWYAPT
eukprot:6269495-Ditylum_brightwellii.AAC.1